ncbi:MAG TPA: biopolymer transporter ExbD [Pyrinomonadaceae bacterium]|nr:biopolymer transporter ExbD [Pyrinomonadaceae bacterium]
MNKPEINVTPLIDVLLVLLIIFMIVTPTRPSSFKARVPSEPTKDQTVDNDPFTLVVAVDRVSNISLNNSNGLGTTGSAQLLTERLKTIFEQRAANHAFLPDGSGAISRAVFIKAPRSLDYGSVAKVVDAVKMSGAEPIALQIDDLE